MRKSFTFGLTMLCLAGMFVGEAKAQSCDRPQLLLVVDKSSSMLNMSGSRTKWDIAVSALTTVTDDFDESIDFGLQVFPMPNRCEPGQIVVDVGRNDSAAIVAGLGEPPPSAGNWTPMAQTLDVAAAYAPLQDDTRENVVVLITDGWQWCDPYDAGTRFDLVESVERLRTQGVTVFVIGFGGGVDALGLNRAAAAAGTAPAGCDPTSSDPMAADNCYLSALDAAALNSALETVARRTADEVCDGIDDDCDGRIDEDFDLDMDTFTTCGTDPDIPGFYEPEWLDCNDGDASINPFEDDICDGIDNDCDGVIDPGCECTAGMTRSCGSAIGACMEGVQRCVGGMWSDCDGDVEPVSETCTGRDNDCDGTVDEDVTCPEGQICESGRCEDFTEPPVEDPDSDMDGLTDEEECPGGASVDTDGDGMDNCFDPDDDNDGILTINERPGRADQDTDRDGRPNHLDPDDDNDGVPTRDERPGDMDQDTDGDGPPNHLDTDDDGDGIPTRDERPGDEDIDTDEDGAPNYLDPDDDNDTVDTRAERPGMMDRDTDGDGTPDHWDTDDDEDGILTRDERPGDMDRDTDGDGPPDHLDNDDDGDTILTEEERPDDMDQDTDSDGRPNHLDPDDDGDNIPTRQEAMEDETPNDDFDMDGTPSYLDEDSDGDMSSDFEEGDEDGDGDGAPNYLDTDGPTMPTNPGGPGAAGGCGCSTNAGANASGLFFLILAIFGFRRRR